MNRMFGKRSYLIFFIVILFIFNKNTEAKQSEEFINFLSSIIYTDCRKEGLIIKKDSLLDFRDGVHFKTINKDIIENYNFADVKEILEIFDSREKFPYFTIINGEKNLLI